MWHADGRILYSMLSRYFPYYSKNNSSTAFGRESQAVFSIPQNCLQSLQKKVIPSGDDSVSMLHGSDHLNQLTVLNPDSAHTTLSHVP